MCIRDSSPSAVKNGGSVSMLLKICTLVHGAVGDSRRCNVADAMTTGVPWLLFGTPAHFTFAVHCWPCTGNWLGGMAGAGVSVSVQDGIYFPFIWTSCL